MGKKLYKIVILKYKHWKLVFRDYLISWKRGFVATIDENR